MLVQTLFRERKRKRERERERVPFAGREKNFDHLSCARRESGGNRAETNYSRGGRALIKRVYA